MQILLAILKYEYDIFFSKNLFELGYLYRIEYTAKWITSTK